MRTVARAMSICVLLAASPVAAQQWVDYVNPEYRFAVNFPVDPSEHDADYVSSSGVTLDRHIFAAEQDDSIYRVSVVMFPHEVDDVAGELNHAAELFRQRGEAIHDAPGDYDGITAHELSVVDPDGRQVFVSLLYHDHRLTIAEGDVSAESFPPIQFQQSIWVVDAEGTPINLEN
jgi:hypothetical protein